MHEKNNMGSYWIASGHDSFGMWRKPQLLPPAWKSRMRGARPSETTAEETAEPTNSGTGSNTSDGKPPTGGSSSSKPSTGGSGGNTSSKPTTGSGGSDLLEEVPPSRWPRPLPPPSPQCTPRLNRRLSRHLLRHPSPRPLRKNPFGSGPSVSRIEMPSMPNWWHTGRVWDCAI